MKIYSNTLCINALQSLFSDAEPAKNIIQDIAAADLAGDAS